MELCVADDVGREKRSYQPQWNVISIIDKGKMKLGLRHKYTTTKLSYGI